ncbi:TPA: hypothetical protein ACPQXX_001373 [Streptococcus mutans]|uniref:hypothetical protein n=1 Tax=Streptococcus mutans TaxID=1309 RepID=UPI0002B599FC|nr:hypothetical protein [Streptococcus mutans]EMB73116.1 hypothetical protein SMU36_03259 [Streptococcus mutans 4VF1]EMC32860.1 hypothetical protein SMU89_05246 [Streptococcus mutans NLML1]MCB5098360.1 hypothetical protein [Streptococcus mutans]
MASKEWYYKNFNMVSELDISGEFLYTGISIVNNMSSITPEMPTELFLALYNISVGIERLQKIILVLWVFNKDDSIEDFSENIKIHNHVELHNRIEKAINKKTNFNKQEHQFLELLKEFYSNARYDRFSEVGNNWEYKLISKFFSDNQIGYEKSVSDSRVILINNSIRKLIGRVLSKIVKKYYLLVEEGSSKSGTYSYELRNDSKAQKIFLHMENSRGLSSIKIDERIALSEILIYLRNTSDKSSYLKFIEGISPLNFDKMEISGYLSVILLENRVPQHLIDEIDYIYTEEDIDVRERIANLDLLTKGNMQVLLDYPYLKEVYIILKNVKKLEDISAEATNKLQESNCYIDDSDIQDIIESVIDIANQYRNNEISREVFIDEFNRYYKNLEDEYILEFIADLISNEMKDK